VAIRLVTQVLGRLGAILNLSLIHSGGRQAGSPRLRRPQQATDDQHANLATSTRVPIGRKDHFDL
jgi:hypothetical protein